MRIVGFGWSGFRRMLNDWKYLFGKIEKYKWGYIKLIRGRDGLGWWRWLWIVNYKFGNFMFILVDLLNMLY